MKRILGIIIAFAITVSAFGTVAVFADGANESEALPASGAGDGCGEYSDASSQNEGEENSAGGETDALDTAEAPDDGKIAESAEGGSEVLTEQESVDVSTDGADDIVDDPSVKAGGGAEARSFFEELYRTTLDNSEKIFSLLAFFASLFLGIAFKKGLAPRVAEGISTVAEGLSLLKEKSEEEYEGFKNLLSSLEAKTLAFEKKVSELSERLISEGELSKERERAREVLLGQTDMLYEIFMHSALPEFEKEEVRKRVAALKEAVANDD